MLNEIDRYFERYENELRQFINHRVSNRFDAEDLFQNLWIKVLINQDSLHKVDNIRAWLFQIARNNLIDFYRKNNKEIPADSIGDVSILVEETESESDNYNKECSSYLLRKLKEMPEKYQLPLWLHVGDNWKHQKISSHINVSLSGSKTRVHRAKSKLKQTLMDCCHVQFDSYGNIVRYESKKLCCVS